MKYRFLSFITLLLFLCSKSFASSPLDGLLERIDSGASKKFVVTIKKADKDYFQLSQKGNKVAITASDPVSAATGLNWYLKYYANVHLSWNQMHAQLPDPLPKVEKSERRETDLKLRYDFNYCTFSYTMPFWDWNRWEEEIDWMALHGVNMPLAAIGIECVYRNMLLKLGYTSDEVNEFISGPAFMAWWAMNNLEGWGGPNPDSWYERQEALQKKILERFKEYGIKPVLPGYYGMMPHNADEKLGINLTKAGKLWNGYQRPALLEPTDPCYSEYARLFYQEQEKLFGKADYYSMDPFHEYSSDTEFDFGEAGKAIMAEMKLHNPKSKWVVQSWGLNPKEEMICNLNPGDLLILDLFSECRPKWGTPLYPVSPNGYGNHQWLFCMLENFGGNVGLHGRMDQLLNNFYSTQTDSTARNLVGIGFTQEGSLNNPVMFELMSELPWRPNAITKEEWLEGYLKARYGTEIEPQIQQAWTILANSIYNCPRGNNQQGTHESIFCCRPNLDNFQASSWSKMQNYYDPWATAQAARLMLEVADNHRGNNNFEYDLVDIVRQSISDHGRLVYQHAIADYKAFDKNEFSANSQKFLRMIQLQDKLLATRPEFKVGTWIDYALNAGNNDEEKRLYEWNARVQVTTWGNRTAADAGKLHDYAHKEWSGMLNDFYYARWEAFFNSLKQEFSTRKKAEPIDFYAIEEPWTLQRNPYSSKPEGDCIDVAKSVYAEVFN